MISFLNSLSVLFALLAAGLWFRSASVRILYADCVHGDMIEGAITIDENGKEYDFIRTAQCQSWWSAWAAVAAALAAIFQGIVLFL